MHVQCPAWWGLPFSVELLGVMLIAVSKEEGEPGNYARLSREPLLLARQRAVFLTRRGMEEDGC